MSEPWDDHYGYELSRRARVRSGVLYPILERWLQQGWLRDGWADHPEQRPQGPPRRYYQLTDIGRRELGQALDVARMDPRFGVIAWAPQY
jgi:PadR family transcriptional regulator, regulatory protein PadR